VRRRLVYRIVVIKSTRPATYHNSRFRLDRCVCLRVRVLRTYLQFFSLPFPWFTWLISLRPVVVTFQFKSSAIACFQYCLQLFLSRLGAASFHTTFLFVCECARHTPAFVPPFFTKLSVHLFGNRLSLSASCVLSVRLTLITL
jgi:uncharacterized protein (DUF486 family)